MKRHLALVVAGAIGAAAVARGLAPAPRGDVWAFTAPWDPASDASVVAHAARVGVLVTGWIALDSATARPMLPSPFPDRHRASPEGPARMAIVTNWVGERFHPEVVRALAADPRRLATTATLVAQHARQMRYAGLVLDLEGLGTGDRQALERVVDALCEAAHAANVTPVTIAVPAVDTAAYALPRLLRAADLALLMLYDQHWEGSGPGPVADPAWVRGALDLRLRDVAPSRVVAALPIYGYRWRRGAPTEPIAWDAARRLVRQAGASMTRDAASGMLTARDPAGTWELWVSDAALVRRLEAVARASGIPRIALWRLGAEDPALW